MPISCAAFSAKRRQSFNRLAKGKTVLGGGFYAGNGDKLLQKRYHLLPVSVRSARRFCT
jgi:hypothetical protein